MIFDPARSTDKDTLDRERSAERYDKSLLVQTATFLLFVFFICFGLLLPASGWNLPSAKKFSLEIAEGIKLFPPPF
jgi:hypothetical protein